MYINIIILINYSEWLKSISLLTLWDLSSMLKEKAKNKSYSDQFQRSSSSSWESCKNTTTLDNSRSSMITEAKRLSLNWSAESTNAESFPPDTISCSLTSKNGLTTFCHQDSSVTSSFRPTKESSPTKNAEKDTSVERSLDFSIELWSVRYLIFNNF